METIALFTILESVDSTNNYAMAKAHAGLAKAGMAWFAREQTEGKGQRGKNWISGRSENIVMSIAIQPPAVFMRFPFVFNAAIANDCFNFLNKYDIKEDLKIKWPNDLFIGDRKAGGMLIENIYHGKYWKWAIIGIGINVNQIEFPDNIRNPVSLKQITGLKYDPVAMAKELHQMILHTMSGSEPSYCADIMNIYNRHLYKHDQHVKLRKQNMVFETIIRGVNEHGQLLTSGELNNKFNFGEVEWIL